MSKINDLDFKVVMMSAFDKAMNSEIFEFETFMKKMENFIKQELDEYLDHHCSFTVQVQDGKQEGMEYSGIYYEKIINIPILGKENIIVYLIRDYYSKCYGTVKLSISWNKKSYWLYYNNVQCSNGFYSERFIKMIETGKFSFDYKTDNQCISIVDSSGLDVYTLREGKPF